MEFTYRKEPNPTIPTKQWIKRPKLQVRLFNAGRHVDLICLVDSGADDCMFHSSVAALLDIDVPTGRYKPYGGIAAGHVVDAYLHPIELQVYGFPDRVSIAAAFTDSAGVDGLLGQSGFFENYQVIFEGYRGRFEVNPRPALTRA